IGLPEQMSIPSLTDQVEGAVFTGTQPPRSLPLNNGRNPSSAAATDTDDNKTAATRQTLIFLCKHMMRGECPRPSAWPSGIPRSSGIRQKVQLAGPRQKNRVDGRGGGG
ncbi:MAG: hypothetical protein HON54_15415, partial [Verrucomicrobia bacterium]|nr:hypothetical protein [Verrucomicrobiota bacterium]